MKLIKLLTCFFILLVNCSCNRKPSVDELPAFITKQLDLAVEQYRQMSRSLDGIDSLPRTFDQQTGQLVTCGTEWWTSGFFPGSLWYLYEYSGDSELYHAAVRKTGLLEKVKNSRSTHDLGFMLYNSYGHAYRLEGKEEYREILLTGAKSLASRYNNVVGCIRSWDHGTWSFPVIIDNMMNLELLFWAANASGDSTYYRIAANHANTTIKNHYRTDYSSYHLVDYDTLTGQVIWKQNVQGAADESAWSRGQAWGLYGFTMAYRETHDTLYLAQARHIASFIIHHPNMPDDGIPYWDFNAPGIPDTYRDASAAAIICSALLELHDYVDSSLAEEYFTMARKILLTLSAEPYRAGIGENGNFLLKHSVGSIPGNSEVNVPLAYADYYYIESLLRMRKLLR